MGTATRDDKLTAQLLMLGPGRAELETSGMIHLGYFVNSNRDGQTDCMNR